MGLILLLNTTIISSHCIRKLCKTGVLDGISIVETLMPISLYYPSTFIIVIINVIQSYTVY